MVDRYFAGEASPAECALIERLLAESPALRMIAAELYRTSVDDDTVGRAAGEVWACLELGIPPTAHTARRRQPPWRRAFSAGGVGVLTTAAAVALLLGGALTVLMWRTRAEDGTHVATHLRTVTAPAGQLTPVSLPDGSRAILSPGSTLRYAVTFGVERRVSLEGEAYFDVDHDARRPFVVRAGDLVAEDLGTQFVVRAYPEDRHGRVVVREGLVRIAGTVVSPGQLGRLDADGRPVVEPADTAGWFAWTRGALVLARMPLRGALPKLSRWYDCEFRLADASLGAIELVGHFPAASREDALNALELALGLHLTRDGRVVTLHAKPRPAS